MLKSHTRFRLAALVVATILGLGLSYPAAAQFGPTSGVVVETDEGDRFTASLFTSTVDSQPISASADSNHLPGCVPGFPHPDCLLFGSSAASADADLSAGTLRASARVSGAQRSDTPGASVGVDANMTAAAVARLFDVITVQVPAGVAGTIKRLTFPLLFSGAISSSEPGTATAFGSTLAVGSLQVCEEEIVPLTEGGSLTSQCRSGTQLSAIHHFESNQFGVFDGPFGFPGTTKLSSAGRFSINVSDELTVDLTLDTTPRTVRFKVSAEITARAQTPNGPGADEVSDLSHTFTVAVLPDPGLTVTSDSGVFPIGTAAPADSTPPTTTATPSSAPNAAGWNRTDVTVALTATDNPGGSGVKEIHFSLTGAQRGSGIIAGATSAVPITEEGTTTLTYFAVDNAGNVEASKSLTVRIDKTPPLIAGLPAAGCTLTPPNHRLVTVGTVTASDALSGLIPGSPTVTATSNESPGAASTAADIVIDGTTVQLRAERAGRGNGRTYMLTASATDVAGNVVTMQATCTVPHDQGR